MCIENNNLTAEQWQAIAEKLASYLYDGCNYHTDCTYCELPCPSFQRKLLLKSKAVSEAWIMKAKKELGYETFRETKKKRRTPFTCKDCYFNHYEPSLDENLILRCIAAKLGRTNICKRFKYKNGRIYGGEHE